jgi:hypothetical protein
VLIDEQAESVEVRYRIGGGFGESRTFERGQRIDSHVFPKLSIPVEQLFTD